MTEKQDDVVHLTGGPGRLTRYGKMFYCIEEIKNEIMSEIIRVADGDETEINRIKYLYPEIAFSQGRITKPDNGLVTFNDYLEILIKPGSESLEKAYLSCAIGCAHASARNLSEGDYSDAMVGYALALRYLDFGTGSHKSPLGIKKADNKRIENRADRLDMIAFKEAVTANFADYDNNKTLAVSDLIVKPQFAKYTATTLKSWITSDIWPTPRKAGRPKKK